MPGSRADQPYLVSEFIEGPSLTEVVGGGGAAGRAGAHRAGHRRGHRAGRHPPGRAGARRLRPGRSHSGRGGAPGGPVQHHPALWHRDPVRRPVLLGPDHPVRRVGRRAARTWPACPGRCATRCPPAWPSRAAGRRPGPCSPRCSGRATQPPGCSRRAPGGPGRPGAAWSAPASRTRLRRRPGPRRAGPPSSRPARPASPAIAHRHHADRHAPWATSDPGRGGHGRARQQAGPGHRDGLAHRDPEDPHRAGRHLVRDGAADRPGARRHGPDPARRRAPRTGPSPTRSSAAPAGCCWSARTAPATPWTRASPPGEQSCDSGVVTLTPQGSAKLAFAFRRRGAASPAGILAKTSS